MNISTTCYRGTNSVSEFNLKIMITKVGTMNSLRMLIAYLKNSQYFILSSICIQLYIFLIVFSAFYIFYNTGNKL